MFIGELIAMAALHELGMTNTKLATCKQVLQGISKPLYLTLPTVEKVIHITTQYSSNIHTSTLHKIEVPLALWTHGMCCSVTSQ